MDIKQLATLDRCCLQERADSVLDASVKLFRLIASADQIGVEIAGRDLSNQVSTIKRCDHSAASDLVEQEAGDMIASEGPAL